MNEELQAKILEMIGNAEAFNLETAPKVIADLLLWAQVKWMIPGSFLLLTVIALAVVLPKAYKRKREFELPEQDFIFLVFASVSVLLAFLVPTLVLLTTALQATVCPYSYLMEWVK